MPGNTPEQNQLSIDENLLDEKVVIFMEGRNIFNDKIFSYLQITLRNLQKLKQALDSGQNFLPADYGTVVAAGKGSPSDELKAEMAAEYNMQDVPTFKSNAPAAAVIQPSLWEDD